jgi:hypothetical protein
MDLNRVILDQIRLCLKSPKSHLETVSTVRGSGWVTVPKCEIAIDYEYDRFTHPLPRTVLTVSKCDVLTFEVSPSNTPASPPELASHLSLVSIIHGNSKTSRTTQVEPVRSADVRSAN